LQILKVLSLSLFPFLMVYILKIKREEGLEGERKEELDI